MAHWFAAKALLLCVLSQINHICRCGCLACYVALWASIDQVTHTIQRQLFARQGGRTSTVESCIGGWAIRWRGGQRWHQEEIQRFRLLKSNNEWRFAYKCSFAVCISILNIPLLLKQGRLAHTTLIPICTARSLWPLYAFLLPFDHTEYNYHSTTFIYICTPLGDYHSPLLLCRLLL
ncbi:hypothetical protein GGR58DRAFT_261294 [Xylaria digitata]|nr:hypothetical protein GGR58DRAFT_261294 [Xylaria digitata]